MSSYAEQLQALHNATLGKNICDLLPLIRHERADIFPPEQRIAVYSDAYRIRMEEAVISDFPALTHLIGNAAMREAVRAFVDVTPSHSWDLNPYSYAFPTFFTSLQHSKGAQDVAQLEGAIVEVFRMPESTPVTAHMFASLGEDGLENTVFSLRKASRLLSFDRSPNAYICAFRANKAPDAPLKASEYLCVVRHDNEVRRVTLESEAYQMLCYIQDGFTFGDAVEKTAGDDTDRFVQLLPGYIGKWLEHGILSVY